MGTGERHRNNSSNFLLSGLRKLHLCGSHVGATALCARGLNACALPPPSHMLKPNSQGDGIRSWGLWDVTGPEDGVLMIGIIITKETGRGPSPLLPCGDTVRR
jgi:hypothetical protein